MRDDGTATDNHACHTDEEAECESPTTTHPLHQASSGLSHARGAHQQQHARQSS